MVEKSRIRKSLHGLQKVRTWQLVILLLLAAFIAATFLRLNNIGMIQRREAVMSADQQGDEIILGERLYELQRYVSSTMNTDLGRGVYLEQSFNRDVQEWQQTQFGDANPNGNIYKKAQEICAPQFQYYSYQYLQCTTNELAKFPAAADPSTETGKPRQEAYIHAYASPLWSADFAGWAVLLTLVIALLIITRLVSLGVLNLMLRSRYKRV